MTPDMMVVVDLDGRKVAGTRDASSELKMHLEVYRQRADVKAVVHAHPALATGFAVAGIPLDRAVLAEVICTLGSIPSPNTRRRRPRSCPTPCASTSRRTTAAAGQPRRADCRRGRLRRVLQDGDDRALREDQPRRRACSGGERLISQEEVLRLQGLRGLYGIASPAPICLDDDVSGGAGGGGGCTCQVVRSPDSPGSAPGARSGQRRRTSAAAIACRGTTRKFG